MGSFKIIAIKTGTTTRSEGKFLKNSRKTREIDYLKNLNTNTIYKFYGNYQFPQNDISQVYRTSLSELSLYELTLANGTKLPVSINAVVGENGSGKSTLIELIYWVNYCLGCKFELLENEKGALYSIDHKIDVQLLYTIDDIQHYILKLKDGNISQGKVDINKDTGKQEKVIVWKEIHSLTDLSDFFYSVVVNYSQYALNSTEVGDWIIPLFHKNDGYQTPIVLNPVRNKGNIDINKEKHLLSRRLQANVLENRGRYKVKESLRNLSNGKIATSLLVSYNTDYFGKANGGKISESVYKQIIEAIQKVFNMKVASNRSQDYIRFVDDVIKYVWIKLRKIVSRYATYKKYKNSRSIKNITELLEAIKQDESHITFKIKGAIFHIKYYNLLYGKAKISLDEPFYISIASYSKAIDRIKKFEEDIYVNTFMMALPSFFNVEVIPEKNLLVETLSSGEKQKVYSLSSIAYHLINLNSVNKRKSEESETEFVRYEYINLILDEIEMYYHPEWQRKYISDLFNYLEKINPASLKNVKSINIMFVTHSPFILSDIPDNNILKLKISANPINEEARLTFAANIHDILAHDFFFKEGFMGEYAKKKLLSLIDFLKKKEKYDSEWNETTAYELIKIIGEPLVSNELMELFWTKYYDERKIDIEIERLESLKTKKQLDDSYQ
jgi:predicted ATP-binding protein involved in virulence